MARLGLEVRYPKRFKVTTDSDHNEAISPNKLDRQFEVNEPNKVWTTDISYVWTYEGWLYIAVVIDLFSRQVVGWAIDDHMRTTLCVVPCKWLSGGENQNLEYFITQIEAANMQAWNTADILIL